MRTARQPFLLLCSVLLVGGCTADKTPGLASDPEPDRVVCKVKSESTTLTSNHATYEYTYGPGGHVSKIEKYIGDNYHVLQDLIEVGSNSTVNHHNLDYPAGSNVITTKFENGGIFDGFPTRAEVAITEKGITLTNRVAYFFYYDAKNRLSKVGKQTDFVKGDHEYDLTFSYNDQDNVIGMSYEFTSGPRSKVTVEASGYDDKPNPFVGIEHWYRVMHVDWDHNDPEPIFTALSKNNLLGFAQADGTKRATAYAYNEHGFPIKRTHTNTSATGSASFEETFEYQCP